MRSSIRCAACSGGTPARTGPGSTAGTECRDDLLTIDGAPFALQVDVPALLAGQTVTATPCGSTTLHLSAGEHHFLSAAGHDTGIEVDGLSLVPDAAQPPPKVPSPSVTIDAQDSTSAQLTVAACPSGCWLIFGQGQNAGWAATADGTALPPSVPVSGGANGWYLPPSTTATHVAIHFTPQRTLNLALGVSGTAVTLCLVLVAWPSVRRRRVLAPASGADATDVDGADPAGMPDDGPSFVAPWSRSSPAAARLGAALLFVACLAFVSVWWAIGSLAVIAVLVRGRRLRMAGIASIIGIGGLGALIAAIEVVRHFPGDGGWPSHFARVHRAGLFLLFLLLVVLVASDSDGDDQTD
ncbi:MAG: hypothetical protein WCK21_09400 [Actinomycetota bacterium]